MNLYNATHIVLKKEDVDKYLTLGEVEILARLCEKIVSRRGKEDKPHNEYIVCDTDETYAEEILNTIQWHEEKKEMRTYGDIIQSLKAGEKPAYEEIRLAALMGSNLLFFANNDIKRLAGEPSKIFTKEWYLSESYTRYHKALNTTPFKWLGNDHPDNPQYRERFNLSNKILDKVLNGMESKDSTN
ncbi:MAG: hypothetical protein K0R00_99 [Herbinix sp.]|jgi:hypothetical protein|nr:hypothetical protein [Herbinix sp.]